MPPRLPPKPGPIRDRGDPQKGRWGGLCERGGRRLDAELVGTDKNTFFVTLTVSSTDGSKLKGPVKFHLHDSYRRATQTIRKVRGGTQAVWEEVSATETFTAGAQAKTHAGEWVGLEYDLTALPGLPRKFVPRAHKPFARWLTQRKTTVIPGIAFKDILTQVLDAFTPADLTVEVQFRLNVSLATEVNVQAAFTTVVFDLLRWADQRGRVGELVRELAAARPQHAGMQAVARKYAGLLSARTDPAEYARFFGGNPAVALQSGGATEAVVAVTDAGFERTRNEALGYFDAAFFADMLSRMSRRVCRAELNDDADTMGTAFLVGPRAVLTNYHVLQKVLERTHPANKVRFRFDFFKAAPDRPPSDGILVGLDGAADPARPWLLGAAKFSAGEENRTPDTPPPQPGELDYALVRLDRAVGGEGNRGWVEVPAAQPPLAAAPLLMILQHPEREPVKLAFDSNPQAVLMHGGLRVRYQVNTEPGSSGSPVFDKEWRLAALHHYDAPGANQGVPIGLIRASLTAAAKAELGGRAEESPRLEVSAAATAALSDRFAAGTAGVSREDVKGIIKQAADTALADPLSPIAGMTEKERDAIDRKMKEADDEWDDKFNGSNDPVEWQKATDRKKMLICNALRQAKQLNGGELPDDWVRRWVKLQCSN